MDASLLQWLKQNKGRQFASPRGIIFGRKPQDIILEDIREDIQEIHISFSKRKTLALPLHFWMFDRALDYLRLYREKAFPIGAAIRPPYLKDSIEGEIWREPRPHKTPYRVAPFILDILVLSGFAEYRYVKSLDTGRKVQGVQLGLGVPRTSPPGATPLPPPSLVPPKTAFLDNYKSTIEEWTERHKEQIIESRLNYTWQRKSMALDVVAGHGQPGVCEPLGPLGLRRYELWYAVDEGAAGVQGCLRVHIRGRCAAHRQVVYEHVRPGLPEGLGYVHGLDALVCVEALVHVGGDAVEYGRGLDGDAGLGYVGAPWARLSSLSMQLM